MSNPKLQQVSPGEIAFQLGLTAAQLKLTHTALKTLLDGLGHEEQDVIQVVQSILAKMPPAEEIQAIDFTRELKSISNSEQ